MNSNEIFHDVIQYLERTIAEGEEINYREIAKIAGSPAALFQRIFMFVSGISLAEYARKRKLTLAGQELQATGISVLEAAVKYGFHSHSAFSRAFREHHGVTPSEVKHGTAILKPYFPLDYAEMRFVGGKQIMAEMKQILYRETPERLIAGVHHRTSFSEAGKAWQAFYQSNAINTLQSASLKKCCDDIEDNAGIGLMYNFADMNHFDLIIGDFIAVDAEIPKGLFTRHIPAGTAAYIRIEGNNIPDILDSAYFLINEAVEKTGREIDHGQFYWGEIYTIERFCKPLERGEKVTIDYLLPVKPIAGTMEKA